MKTYLKPLGIILIITLLLSCLPFAGVSAETFYIENGFKFTKSAQGEITIHAYTGNDSEITIPENLIGLEVKYIYDYAFLNNVKLTKVNLPNTLQGIGKGAFYGCTNLESANIPVNCTTLGDYLFYNCTSLRNVSFNSVADYIPRFCFSRCGSLETLVLPETVKNVGEYAFSYCNSLKDIYLPRFTSAIDSTAFYETPQAIINGYCNTVPHTYSKEHYIAFRDLDTGIATFYVTYYNYDDSVYWITPVQEGKFAMMPSKAPTKPSTDTHNYEFMYWDGKTTNISANTKVYPVFAEVPIPVTYNVVFLDGDNSVLKSQQVNKGESANPPSAVPQKENSDGKYYTFIGWDKPFDNIVEDTVISPLFSEHTIYYTVVFLDGAGKEIVSYQVAHGEASPIPETIPEYSTNDEIIYEFDSWDTDTTFVTSDLIVKPVFKETKPIKPPVITTGTLNITITGGTGFKISVNGGTARPQGSTYINAKMPVASKVTVAANTTSGNEFLGWMNDKGVVVSVTDTYTFTTTGNDYIKAVYKTDIESVNLVIFKNDKAAGGNGQILDMQHYYYEDEITFPEDASQTGYIFTGWSMTEEEIKTELRAGKDVVVVPVFEVRKVYVDITVTNGEITTHGGMQDGKYLAYKGTTVTADAAPEGKKFAYWTDAEGNIKSYDAEYKFYPSKDTELVAVYVAESEEIQYNVLADIAADSTVDGNNISFVISWNVPSSVGTFVKGGILVVDSKNYDPETFVVGTKDSNVTQGTPTKGQQASQPGYSLTKQNVCLPGSTWYGVTWVQYEDAKTGETITVYSDMIEVTKY